MTRTFSKYGRYGVVGVCENGTKVFKIAQEINRDIKHEYTIIKDLNILRDFCPHFVHGTDVKTMDISEKYMYSPEEYDIYYKHANSIPREVLFMDVLQKKDFASVLKSRSSPLASARHSSLTSARRSSSRSSLCSSRIMSQVCQVLMGLEIAQRYCKFTHYDLHYGNILLQKCSPSSLFLYILEGKTYCFPTFGYYPVIIDMGLSYSRGVDEATAETKKNDSQMCTFTDNYDYGYHSTIFDPLSDVHRFLICVFYDLKRSSSSSLRSKYRKIDRDIHYIFRHLNIIKDTGEKKMQNDITRIVMDKIKKYCYFYDEMTLYKNFKKEILQLCNGLITLPLREDEWIRDECRDEDEEERRDEDDIIIFQQFILQLQKICNRDQFYIEDYNDNHILYVIKVITDSIYYQKSLHDVKTQLSQYSHILRFSSEDEWITFSKLGISLGKVLSHIYYKLRRENEQYLEAKYLRTVIQSPLDAIVYLCRECTINYTVDTTTEVHVFDTDNHKNYKYTLADYSEEEIEKINKSNFLNKGNYILK